MLNPRLIVEVYDNVNFTGKKATIVNPVNNVATVGMQQPILSAKVYRGPGSTESENYKVIFYDAPNLQGRKFTLGPGYYPNLHDIVYNFGERIVSINIAPPMASTAPSYGAIPVIIDLFEKPGFQGLQATIVRDIDNTDALGLPGLPGSLRVQKGPNFPSTMCRIHFYEGVGFEGRDVHVELKPYETGRDIPNLQRQPATSGGPLTALKSVNIETWTNVSQFSVTAYNDAFNQPEMNPRWQWTDPKGAGAANKPGQGFIEMICPQGVGLWHGNPAGQGGNMEAPRLLRPVTGDFAIETRLYVTNELKEHGGLLVWKDENAYIRLEKTSGAHNFKGDARYIAHVNKIVAMAGRSIGLARVPALYLKIEREGNVFTGLASRDGTNWQTCSIVTVAMTDPVMVGMYAMSPGDLPPTVTRFEYFRVYRK